MSLINPCLFASRTLAAAAVVVVLGGALPTAVSAGEIFVYQRPNGTRLVTDHVRADPNLRLVRRYTPKSERKPARFQIPANFPIGANLVAGGKVGGNASSLSTKQLRSALKRYRPRPMNSKFDALIKETAATYGVEPSLVRAVVQAESAFKPDAVSVKGATGLMQLMPGTAERYGVENRKDPKQNVNGGVRYLRDLLAMFGDNIALAVAAYNAGEGAVKKHQGIPPYKETQNYVRKVMRLHRMYKAAT